MFETKIDHSLNTHELCTSKTNRHNFIMCSKRGLQNKGDYDNFPGNDYSKMSVICPRRVRHVLFHTIMLPYNSVVDEHQTVKRRNNVTLALP